MSNSDKQIIFFQIPKILHEDSKIKSQHIYIFMILYDQLRQREQWNKTNQWLAEQTKIGIRQIKIYLNELEEWGYLSRKGMGSNRQFSLGDKLITKKSIDKKENNGAEKVPVSNQYRAEKVPVLGGIGTSNRAEKVLDSNNLFKNIIKNISPNSKILKTTPNPLKTFAPPTTEQIDLMNKFDNGELTSDLDIFKARTLKKRYEPKEG